jgi:F-type H+-transporting ATPase subunit a
MLEQLGEKLILNFSIGAITFRFDVVATIMLWFVILIVVALALVLRRGLRQKIEEKPTRTQAALETLINLIESQLTSGFASARLVRKLFPFIATLFIFLLLSNWLSIIPYFFPPTANFNITLGLALLVFLLSHWFAIQIKGPKEYFKGFIKPYPFLLPINIIGELAKPLSHSFRLFGNIFGGMAIVYIVSTRVPVLIPLVLNAFFGLFVGLIQAFVFTLLAVVYINITVEG